MKRTLARFRQSAFGRYIDRNEKYLPIVFFVAGFIFDSLTLGRIDRAYDMTVLWSHMTLLTLFLYLFNLADDGTWNNTLLGRYQQYLPLAIQFFFGALSSAYVIYFSRSVSLTKTTSFFVILVILLFANEFLKRRISNKYLQFSIYFFISFIFFSFMIPVLTGVMNTTIFLLSGAVSLGITLFLIIYIYRKSPSTRKEVHLGKLTGLILTIYLAIHVFYYFNLIPPVPLALETGIVAHEVRKENDEFIVTYEKKDPYIFWRDYRYRFTYESGERVYLFSSIFAPSALEEKIIHRWMHKDQTTNAWKVMDEIGYEITGGRESGYRGYTYKENIIHGEWRVEVVTDDDLILGHVDFKIISASEAEQNELVQRSF
ncbi:DUF2914 domain-containing protein [Robertkochia aurantiaca]|uniref:DUF2914 domain-containing protein n=1 Tax=Robertkochia aurantiaca TaxID=2873700 RepID=UPI001CCF23B5|nr:DUF2914 domain-containing protein [Robertkochia sp. 3YJGBD-33]